MDNNIRTRCQNCGADLNANIRDQRNTARDLNDDFVTCANCGARNTRVRNADQQDNNTR